MKGKLWRWPDEWRTFLQDNFPGRTAQQITDLFNAEFGTDFSRSIVHGACTRYKIRNGIPYQRRNAKYTEEHFDFMRDFIPGHSEQEIIAAFADKFGIKITTNIVGNLKHKIGVKSGTIGGRFRKGISPTNKGKKWDEFMTPEGMENSRKTTFKRGQLPLNSTPVGTERITKDGYIEVRVDFPVADYTVQNKRGHTHRKYYILKHRYVWEQAHGPVPKNHAIIFLDQNKQNCSLENLALITRAQLARLCQGHLLTTDSTTNKTAIALTELITKTHRMEKQNKKKKKWTATPAQRERMSLAQRKWRAEKKGENENG